MTSPCQAQRPHRFGSTSTTLALWKHAEKSADGSAGNDKEPQAERTAWRGVGALQRSGGDGRMFIPSPRPPNAAQTQRRPPSPHSEDGVQGAELAGLRSRLAQARQSDLVDVRPAKAGMFSRRQTCRGRSQSPVVWIAEEMETKPSKPIDKVSSGEATSHRAVTTVNALWPRKVVFPACFKTGSHGRLG
jgi:hypothetical protein